MPQESESSAVAGSGYPTRTWRRFHLFIPAIILTWLLVEVAAPQVPRAPWLAQAGLLLLCLEFYLAAAARACDLFSENVVWLAISRAGVMIEPMLVLFLLGIFSGACSLIAMYLNPVWLRALMVTGALVVDLYVLARVWPVWGIPFHFTGKLAWSPSARASVWRGPGLGLAWRLTRELGVFNRCSLRFMGLLIPLIMIVTGLRFSLASSVIPDIILYVFGLPQLSVLAVDGAGLMLRVARSDAGQDEWNGEADNDSL